MDEVFKQEFLINAMSGCSKTQLIRTYKEELDCTEEEIEELLEQKEFNTKPIFIDYFKFYNLEIPLTATRLKYPFTQLYIQDDFLNKVECEKLINEIEKRLEPSFVANPDDSRIVSDYRTSSSSCFNYKETKVGVNLDLKIARYLGLDPFIGEWVQGQKYESGQFYKEHHDFFHPFTEEYKTYTEWMGQRTWTAMLYLNDVEDGGETYFKYLNLRIKPERGKLLFWNNLYPMGIPNYKTMHEACPPVDQNKYIITKWFRSWPLIN